MKNNQEKKGKTDALNDIYNGGKEISQKEEISNKLKSNFTKFWKSERGLPYLVIVFGFIAIVFGLWHSKVNLRGNFLSSPSQGDKNISLNKALTQQELSELSAKDTDNDGLSDYDELYVFNTSPYLEDSDSDDISDKAEIAAGLDPNCPKGKTCLQAPAKEQEEISPGLPNINIAENNEIIGDQRQVIDMLSGLSADDLRSLLIEAGAPESLLEDVSDEQLLNMAQDVLRQQGE